MMWLHFVKQVLSKESDEVFISFHKTVKLQRNSWYESFFHKGLFVWNLPCFIMGIVISLLVNGLLPCQEQRLVP